MRRWLPVLVCLLPGGLLLLLGILVASVGVGLCLPGLRRMTAASRGTVGDEIALPREQSHGASPDSGPRAWVAPQSMEVH
jgi:hypothetical protein